MGTGSCPEERLSTGRLHTRRGSWVSACSGGCTGSEQHTATYYYTLPNDFSEQLSVRFVRVEVKYIWFQLLILQSIAKQNCSTNEVNGSLALQ